MSRDQGFLGTLVRSSIEKYRIVYLGALILTLAGLWVYTILPRESKPDVVFPTIKVSVNYPGASPGDVEALVTNRLEAVLLGLADLEFITSSSLAGRSELQLDFYPESDVNEKYDAVSRALDSVRDLPLEADPPVVKVSTTANRAFFVVSLSGDLPPSTLQQAALMLENRFRALAGVSEVTISGLPREELRINYDPARLAEFRLAPDQLVQAVRARNKDTPAGTAQLDGLEYFIRVLGAYTDAEEVGLTQVSLPGGGTRLLKDLATVERVAGTATGYSRRAVRLGTPDAAMLPSITVSLYRTGGTDIVGPSKAALQVLDDPAGLGFPDGLDIQVLQNDAVSVQQDLADVLSNAVSGLVIVVLVLYLFVGLRESIIISLIIPFSMFFGFLALQAFGMTFNSMTLLAMIISLGLLVDNSIVVVETVVSHRLQGKSRKQAALDGANEVASSIVSATLTTMAAFIPLALMEGRVGQLISVIPLTVLFIIGGSLVVALTLSPALAARMLPLKTGAVTLRPYSGRREVLTGALVLVLAASAFLVDGRPTLLTLVMAILVGLFMAFRSWTRKHAVPAFDRFGEAYERLLHAILNRKLVRTLIPLGLLLSLILVLATIPLGLIKIELFPVKDESSLYALITAPEFSTLEATDALTRRAESVLLKLDGVSSLYTEVGLTSARDAQIVMNLLPPGQRTWTTQQKIPQLMQELGAIPGVKISLGTQAGGKVSNSPVQIKLRGSDLEQLRETSQRFVKALSSLPDVQAPTSDWERGFLEVQVLPRSLVAEGLGVDTTSLGAIVRSYVSGQVAGILIENGEELEIRLAVIDSKLNEAEDLESVLVPLKNGTTIPLTHLANLAQTSGYGTIRHSQGERTVTILAQLQPGANIRDVVGDFDALAAGLDIPDGLQYYWAGEAADLDDSLGSMTINLAIALLLVFLILAVQFHSLSQPVVVLVSVPLAVIGIFLGLMLSGNNFGLYAFMGVIALVGISVNDAIVLVETINRLRREGLALMPALVQSGRSRLAPVLSTSLTTIGGLLPLAFTDVNFAQLSISLISGLFASTVLTLLMLPLLYYYADHIKAWVQARIPVFIDDPNPAIGEETHE
ncbi:MAG: efflux RND transporter permease subunit [Clostridia bacterium]